MNKQAAIGYALHALHVMGYNELVKPLAALMEKSMGFVSEEKAEHLALEYTQPKVKKSRRWTL